MTLRPVLGFVFAIILPLGAHAADQQCLAACEEQETFCGGAALEAINEGVFSGSGCSGYSSCNDVVEMCEAERATCEAACE